jgi:DMSO/TMAO reductase YedYZ molybdopterin-dependent catalytic subunit
MKWSRIGAGALAGLALTVPLTVMFFLGNRFAGLPLVPFDLFEWLTRILPGGLITGGIDAMVTALTAFGFSVRETAKAAEQTMAVVLFLMLGTGAGALWFVLVPRLSSRSACLGAGLLFGGLLGGILGRLSIATGQSASTDTILSLTWVVGLFLAWGVLLAWIETRLFVPLPAAETYTRTEAVAPTDVEPVDRRTFLIILGGASAAISLVGAAIGAAWPGRPEQTAATPGTAPSTARPASQPGLPAAPAVPVALPPRPDTVEPAPGTRPEYTPLEDHYRIDINLSVPKVDGASWELPITGLVDKPLTLTLDDFHAQRWGEPANLLITLACISNPIGGDLIGTTQWTGIPFRRVLEEAGVRQDAAYIQISSADGFYETVPLDMIRADERIMLTYLWDGQPLTAEHGYPLRIYIPNRYGMKQPKWITAMAVTEEYEEGYWVERDWDETAAMKATSVIDSVAVDDVIEAGDERLIPIGGIAHAGDRGISKVEVQVDGGEWQEAQLRTPLSGLTWVLWRYDWPFATGFHTFAVRCTDGNGDLQVMEASMPHPSGATGVHTVRRQIDA